MKVFTIFLYIFLFLFLIILHFPRIAYASVIFEDNFSDNINKWIFFGDGGWTNSNGEYGIHLNPGLSNSVPSDEYWNNCWKNVKYQVKLRGVSGTDKNILLRFQDSKNWYGIHHTYGMIYFEKVINGNAIPITPPVNYPLENGINYTVDIEIQGKRIKVLIDNNLIFNFEDPAPYLEYGKIGLRAGTGAVTPTEVWFDDVIVTSLDECAETTPTPTPTSNPPIIFLPGLGASFNFQEMFLGIDNPTGWQLTPGAKVYTNLFKAFENTNHFYVFYYDWRKPVEESASKLKNFIANTVQPSGPITLIGHSLGGLIARTCIQKNADLCQTQKLITLGSPHQGAVQTYPVAAGGEVWGNNIIDLGMEILLHYYRRPWETKRETAVRAAPVLLDLLPIFDFLQNQDSLIPWQNLSLKNLLLPSLADISSIQSMTSVFIGQSFPTYGKIIVGETAWLNKILGNWPDGQPVAKIYEDGDATVLAKSAALADDGIEHFKFNFDHTRLVSDEIALEKIFQTLGLALPEKDYQPPSEENDYLILFAHSPVTLTSLDIKAEDFAQDEMIIISNPEDKIYTFEVTGTANAFYQLSFGQFHNGQCLWHDYFGQAEEGKSQTVRFQVWAGNSNPNPLFDPQGETTLSFLRAAIAEFKKEAQSKQLSQDAEEMLSAFLTNVAEQANEPEKALSNLFLIRDTINFFKAKGIINHEEAAEFRDKTEIILRLLNYLASLSPRETNQQGAQEASARAHEAQNAVNQGITRTGAFIYLSAQAKLEKALDLNSHSAFYPGKLHAQEAANLFRESLLIPL